MQNNYAEQTSCLKEFARYTSLNVLGMIGLSCYILADTFFVAKGLGTSGLAALQIRAFGSDFYKHPVFRRNYGPYVLPGRTFPVPADYSASGR